MFYPPSGLNRSTEEPRCLALQCCVVKSPWPGSIKCSLASSPFQTDLHENPDVKGEEQASPPILVLPLRSQHLLMTSALNVLLAQCTLPGLLWEAVSLAGSLLEPQTV